MNNILIKNHQDFISPKTRFEFHKALVMLTTPCDKDASPNPSEIKWQVDDIFRFGGFQPQEHQRIDSIDGPNYVSHHLAVESITRAHCRNIDFSSRADVKKCCRFIVKL